MAVVITAFAIFGLRRRGRGRGAGRGGGRSVAALDDLVEFAAIEPYAAALRAIIDLDPLTFRHRQIHAAGRAKQALGVGHGYSFLKGRSEEHTSELQSLMRISYAVFCLK